MGRRYNLLALRLKPVEPPTLNHLTAAAPHPPRSDAAMSLPYADPERNQVRVADQAAHCWYRFVLSYPPHLVQAYLSRFGITPQQRVLDPFCGTGTTVVECKKQGIASVGVEANPMAWYASSVKVQWGLDAAQLAAIATDIATATEAALLQWENHWLTLPADSQQLLLKNSISPLPLHKTLVLLEQMAVLAGHATNSFPTPSNAPCPSFFSTSAATDYSHHLRLALAKALVTGISNLRFGPEVGVGKPKADAPVVETWLQAVRAIAQDLPTLQSLPATTATIHYGDARQLPRLLQPHSIDAVITSPPYPNEKDYTRTTRLESVLLGLVKNRANLRAFKQGLIRSNTRNIYKADTDDGWVSQHPEIQHIARTIEARRCELGKTSGFERLYPRAVTLYFGGMARHLAELRPLLRSGAQLAYVVGDQKSYLQVLIRTGQILAELAEGLGYEVLDIELFRTRTATATKEQMREEVVLLRWPGPWPDRPYPFGVF